MASTASEFLRFLDRTLLCLVLPAKGADAGGPRQELKIGYDRDNVRTSYDYQFVGF